jgi:acetolactate synthase-1/2/3 large subunit
MPGVADYLIDRLRAAGLRTLFGLPGGGGNLDLIQAAGRAGLPFVLTTTETGSAIAAIAQAEITGAPGACITTLGPGAASVVNGIVCAKLDRVPLLVITDSYASGTTFEHQRLDHQQLLAPVVKWSGSLAPDVASQNIGFAFDRLAELPPGPVHLDCPANFEEAHAGDGGLGARSWGHTDAFSDPAFRALVTAARKPILIVGLAARQPAYAAAVRALCEARRVPALVTYKAKGVVPDSHPWFAGVFTHGAIERPILDESDLIIGIGFDPVEILPRPWNYRQPVISIARWEMAEDHVPFRGQHVGTDEGIDLELAEALTQSEWDQSAVRAHAETARRAVLYAGSEDPASSVSRSLASSLTPQTVVTIAAAQFAGSARVTVDAGAHMLPAAVLWPVSEPNDLLISNGLSTMGFALPAAIGAALLDRSRPVVALTGDGGLLICMGELATLARERLRVIVIVLNDSSLSLIEIKQQARRLPPAGVALGDLNWTRIAEGFGIPAWSAGTAAELEAALDRAATANGPSLIDARIDRSNYPDIMKAIRG